MPPPREEGAHICYFNNSIFFTSKNVPAWSLQK